MNAIYISNNETSDETLSDENISTSSNSDEEHTDKKLNPQTRSRRNASWRECGQLVKTQGSTGNFQSHLNAHEITKPTQINSIAAQPTIDEMFQNAVKQNPCQKESIERALPFYVLQSESFVKLIYTLNPYYELPSNKQIKARIHQSYNNSIEYLKTLLVTELKTCSLTCDLWTARSKNSYLEITCHFINSNYKLKEIILVVKYIPYPHDAITNKTDCNLSVASASIEEIDLMDASDVFDDIEEDIVDLDEEFATITIANGNVIKLNQPQNTDGLVNKIKKNLYAALKYYWDALIDRSLVATLLDPRCKSMKQLDGWERNKAISLLQENYELLNIENETTNSPNKEQNKDQLNLFSIMFGSDNVSIKNEVERYLKIDQENQQLDYDNGFLENHLDRPPTSIIALIKDIEPNDIIEIWKLIYLSNNYKYYVILLSDIRYANGFRKIKKALNVALDLGCEEELINLMTHFIDQKKSAIENRLKSSSESHCHKELAPHAINLQSSSLGMPFSNIDLNSHIIDNNVEELCHG
ncbi:20691_t:CDS:2, partial [Gigaspora margarita]